MKREKIRPFVRARTKRGEKVREGRGFSLKEIGRAGLNIQKAKKHGIPVDMRRQTSYPENVQTLKEQFKTYIPLTEIKGIGKVAEEELQKADILDVYDLANVDLKILTDKVPHSKKTLKRWHSEANKLLKK